MRATSRTSRPDYALSVLGRGVSMGVHESQSRIYENQLARSAPFTGWLYGRMRELFGDIGVESAEAFHAAVNNGVLGPYPDRGRTRCINKPAHHAAPLTSSAP